MTTKFVNIAFKAYATTTLYVCELEDIKVGDFVIVPSWTGELTGRIMSFSQNKGVSLKKPQSVLRKATPQEINEVADVFGVPKDPAYSEDEEDDSFLTNSGYGTRELNKMMKKLQKQQETKAAKNQEEVVAEKEPAKKSNSPLKEDAAIPGYLRYFAILVIGAYVFFNYLDK